MAKRKIVPQPIQPIPRLHLGQLSHISTAAQFASDADPCATIVASEFGLRSEALASYDGDEE